MILRLILFLTLLTLVVSKSPYQRYGVLPIFEDDPELYVTYTTPYDDKYYWMYTPGADYLGNLFTGKSEFPWIVNVLVDDADKYTQATGNLITGNAVITSCRALVFFKRYYDQLDAGDGFSESNINEMLVLSQIKVFYCSIYLYEDMKKKKGVTPRRSRILPPSFKGIPGQVLRPSGQFFPTHEGADYTGYTSGVRHVSRIVPHPKCSAEDMSLDIAVIILRGAISPVPPHISYMPVFINLDLRIADVDLVESTEQGKICYIASFGKDYANWHDHYVVDYKVKYRVYYEDFDVCMRSYDFYECAELDSNDKCREPFYLPSQYDQFFCWRTRARVGAVCDHDRGSPLVCDGRVYGIVTRGFQFTYCNNLNAVGVIVLKASYIASYYLNFVESQYKIRRSHMASKTSINSVRFEVHILLYLCLFISTLNFGDNFD